MCPVGGYIHMFPIPYRGNGCLLGEHQIWEMANNLLTTQTVIILANRIGVFNIMQIRYASLLL